MTQLTQIGADTTIWTIYGLDAPEELGGEEHLIGDLITTSATNTSLYGD